MSEDRREGGDPLQGRRSNQKREATYGPGGSYQAVQEGVGVAPPPMIWPTRASAVFGPVRERNTRVLDSSIPASARRQTPNSVYLVDPKPRGEIVRNLKELWQLPQEVWKKVDRPVPGYNYRAEVTVVGLPFIALLDTGASTNAIPEELVVDLINEARARGFKWRTAEWPIDLETWDGKDEIVTGIARSQELRVMGAVVLPVVFTGLNGRKVTQAMRFKIFARGGSGWMGLIIGPSLEPPPLGLGLPPGGVRHDHRAL